MTGMSGTLPPRSTAPLVLLMAGVGVVDPSVVIHTRVRARVKPTGPEYRLAAGPRHLHRSTGPGLPYECGGPRWRMRDPGPPRPVNRRTLSSGVPFTRNARTSSGRARKDVPEALGCAVRDDPLETRGSSSGRCLTGLGDELVPRSSRAMTGGPLRPTRRPPTPRTSPPLRRYRSIRRSGARSPAPRRPGTYGRQTGLV